MKLNHFKSRRVKLKCHKQEHIFIFTCGWIQTLKSFSHIQRLSIEKSAAFNLINLLLQNCKFSIKTIFMLGIDKILWIRIDFSNSSTPSCLVGNIITVIVIIHFLVAYSISTSINEVEKFLFLDITTTHIDQKEIT